MPSHIFGIGPMSSNVVDACIAFANEHEPLILIPSRRQVEWSRGYTGWTTQEFAHYVRARSDAIVLMRDHAGPAQGDPPDDYLMSLFTDTAFMDAIHIDPWKQAGTFVDGCVLTAAMILYCHELNPDLQYEVGTEEAIFSYDANQLDILIRFLREGLEPATFDRIQFAVIQSGTSLRANENTGTYDPERLGDMLAVCRAHGLMSKEHNADYLASSVLHAKFAAGLTAANVAPEMGQLESQTYLDAIGDDANTLDILYRLCYDSGRWRKWMSTESAADKVALVNVAGHYVLNHPDFHTHVKSRFPEIDQTIQARLTARLKELHGIA